MEDYLIRNYIKRNLADLLAKTAKIYPAIFTPDIIAEEMALLSTQVAGMDITYNLLTRQQPPPVQPPSIAEAPAPVIEVLAPVQEQPAIVSSAKPRCIARIMDKGNPITQDSHGNKIYGKQCNYRESDPVTHKCGAHAKHCPHGDFMTEPSEVLKQHFQHVQSKLAKKDNR